MSGESIRFTLNGRRVAVSGLPPTTTLLDYLHTIGKTGSKEGCAEGDCGACTVAILDGQTWRAVNSCLVLLPTLHGGVVLTVEGLSDGHTLHPAQQALVDRLGSQCGYCTPGFVMSLFAGSYRDDLDAQWKRDDQLCGNLCRCTGYRPIRDALRDVAGSCPAGRLAPQVAAVDAADAALQYTAGAHTFLQPTTLSGLWQAIAAHPEHRFIAGGTDLGLEVTKRHQTWPALISLGAIDALRTYEETDAVVSIGAALPLAELEGRCPEALPPLARMLRYFASRQIKNRATVGGNLCNASPIGDLAPVLIALGAEAVLRSAGGSRRLSVEALLVGYRQTALQPGEILAAVAVPRIAPGWRMGAYKVSKRRELDISAVCAGMAVRLDDGGCVADIRLAYGGMAATTQRATATEQALRGQPWTAAAVRTAAAHLSDDFTPISDHRSSAWYRITVAKNLLIGFQHETETASLPCLPDRPTGTVLGAQS